MEHVNVVVEPSSIDLLKIQRDFPTSENLLVNQDFAGRMASMSFSAVNRMPTSVDTQISPIPVNLNGDAVPSPHVKSPLESSSTGTSSEVSPAASEGSSFKITPNSLPHLSANAIQVNRLMDQLKSLHRPTAEPSKSKENSPEAATEQSHLLHSNIPAALDIIVPLKDDTQEEKFESKWDYLQETSDQKRIELIQNINDAKGHPDAWHALLHYDVDKHLKAMILQQYGDQIIQEYQYKTPKFEKKDQMLFCRVYQKAITLVPPSLKKVESYILMNIELAFWIKESQGNADGARDRLKDLKSMHSLTVKLPTYHIRFAELEVIVGNKEKAKAILESARDKVTSGIDLVESALQKLQSMEFDESQVFLMNPIYSLMDTKIAFAALRFEWSSKKLETPQPNILRYPRGRTPSYSSEIQRIENEYNTLQLQQKYIRTSSNSGVSSSNNNNNSNPYHNLHHHHSASGNLHPGNHSHSYYNTNGSTNNSGGSGNHNGNNNHHSHHQSTYQQSYVPYSNASYPHHQSNNPGSYSLMPHMPEASSSVNCFIVNSNRYIFQKEIGKGASSSVYKVRDERTGVDVALKRVKLDTGDASVLQGFMDEIKLLNSLQDCDRIVKLYDAEITKDHVNMVMECGETDLQKVLQERRVQFEKDQKEMETHNVHIRNTHFKMVDEEFIRLYFKELLMTVHAVHKRNIIHADLKPQNFLFVGAKLKLIDFGISKFVPDDTSNISRDSLAGTANYMAPEVVKSFLNGQLHRSRDHSGELVVKQGTPSDVWSLGCMLYQMVYAVTPFQHIKNPHQKLLHIANEKTVIEYSPIENQFLLNMLRCILERNPAKRATIPELLEHPFLNPGRSFSGPDILKYLKEEEIQAYLRQHR